MSEVKKYDHSVIHRPGDEGSESSEQGKTYSDADCDNEAAPLGGSHDHVHRPGNEGKEFGGDPDKMATTDRGDYIQGYQNAPPKTGMEEWLKGPEVRRTKVEPATNANPYGGFPGGK